MPLLRYFTFVGIALLALLMVVSSNFPGSEIIIPNYVDRPVIRIASDRVAPARVDIDTCVQTAVVVPPSVPEIPEEARSSVVEAQLSAQHPTPAAAHPTPAAAHPKPAAAPIKIERRKAKIARGPIAGEWQPTHKDFNPFI